MDRAHGRGFGAVIEAGLALVPAAVHPLLACDWLTGTDAVFAGLHRYGGSFTYTDASGTFSYTYQENPHTVYPHHQRHLPKDRRVTTVVLPRVFRPDVVVHELGHVLHQRLDWRHHAQRRVTDYAHRDAWEAFAEAFTSWCVPGYGARPDEATVDLFERLADPLEPSRCGT